MAVEKDTKVSYYQLAIWLVMFLMAVLMFGARDVVGRVDTLEKVKVDKEQYYREYDNIGEQLEDVKELLQQHVEL